MERLTLAVCPHDTASNPERWFLFTQYLNQRLQGVRVGFEPVDGFADFRDLMLRADLVYANPQDSHVLCTEHGFQPLARPSNLFDEVVIIADPELGEVSLRDIAGQMVASVPTMLPTCQALARLSDAAGVRPAAIRACDSWLGVMNAVRRGRTPYGFVYRDYFDGLGMMSQRMVRVVEKTDTRSIQHTFVIGGSQGRLYRRGIAALLSSMHEDGQGRERLQALSMACLESVDEAALERIATVQAHCERVAVLSA